MQLRGAASSSRPSPTHSRIWLRDAAEEGWSLQWDEHGWIPKRSVLQELLRRREIPRARHDGGADAGTGERGHEEDEDPRISGGVFYEGDSEVGEVEESLTVDS